MTHEFVHMGVASLADEHHWLEEGLAIYVEPIARAQDGQLTAEKVWRAVVSGMPKGSASTRRPRPRRDAHLGPDVLGRRNALLCLVADVEIRQATGNRKGLQDALRAIVAAGATINTDSALPLILHIGDQATGTTVLSDLYQRWKDTPVNVNLDQLWRDLGVRTGPNGIDFDDDAPLAQVRRLQGHRSRNNPDEPPIGEIMSPAPGSLIGAGDRFVWVREQRCR